MSYNKKITRRTKRRFVKGKGLTNKQKMQVNRLIEIPKEKKYHDFVFDAAGISETPYFTDITRVDQGTDNNERIGGDIDLLSISFNLIFSVADTTNWIKMVIFQWYPNRAVNTPSWVKLFQYPDVGNPASQYQRISPFAIGKGNSGTFKVLKKFEIILDSTNPIQQVNGFINKGFKRNVNYADFVSNSGTNHIYVLLISDSAAISHPVIDGTFRLRYTDA